MSASTRSEGGLAAATRNVADFLGASSTQRHIGSPQRDMIYPHHPHNENGPGNAANAPGPPPSKRELT